MAADEGKQRIREETDVPTESMTNNDIWTVQRILGWTIGYLREHGSASPRLDAEVLLAHARECERIQLYTQYDQTVTDEQRAVMRDLVRRRASAEPVAYLVGHREFFSLDFAITPDVFIPRPDTEVLVMAALDAAKSFDAPRILDLCTGTACVPIALAKNRPQARLTAVEFSAEAYEVATRNVATHGFGERIRLIFGDLFEPISEADQFDMIVSNPPYIPCAEIPELQPDVRDHEPHIALDGGEDGLDVIRRLISQAPDYLVSGGWLMFELSPEQASTAQGLMDSAGYDDIGVRNDLSGSPRVVVGRSGPMSNSS